MAFIKIRENEKVLWTWFHNVSPKEPKYIPWNIVIKNVGFQLLYRKSLKRVKNLFNEHWNYFGFLFVRLKFLHG